MLRVLVVARERCWGCVPASDMAAPTARGLTTPCLATHGHVQVRITTCPCRMSVPVHRTVLPGLVRPCTSHEASVMPARLFPSHCMTRPCPSRGSPESSVIPARPSVSHVSVRPGPSLRIARYTRDACPPLCIARSCPALPFPVHSTFFKIYRIIRSVHKQHVCSSLISVGNNGRHLSLRQCATGAVILHH